MTGAAEFNLDGEIRDGRHVMLLRVYYEDTDFPGSIRMQDGPFGKMDRETGPPPVAFPSW
jgi:acyl-CoA thioester hydrolase